MAWSAIGSLVASISVLAAAFFQWWTITYNGQMLTKAWVKAVLASALLLNVGALALVVIAFRASQ